MVVDWGLLATIHQISDIRIYRILGLFLCSLSVDTNSYGDGWVDRLTTIPAMLPHS